MATSPTHVSPADARTVDLFGSRVHYWTYHPEKTRVIFMIHGYRGTHEGLQEIIDRLPDFKIIIPDLPGFGHTTPMTKRAHSISGYADMIRQLVHELGYEEIILLGHSMGTVIGAEIVALEPRLVTQLILINPIAEPPLEGMGAVRMAPGILYHWLGAQALPEKLGTRLLSSKLLFLVGSVNMTKTKDRLLRKKIHASHLYHMGRFHNRATLLDAYRASVKGTVTDRAADIAIPTLMVAGQKDSIAPIKGARKLVTALAQGRLVEIPGVGHIIHFEKPAETAAAINEFLS